MKCGMDVTLLIKCFLVACDINMLLVSVSTWILAHPHTGFWFAGLEVVR